MQIASNGEIMKNAGYVPQFEGMKLHIDGCMNETVTVTLDADSVRFGGASKDSYKPGTVPDEYSSLGIYDRRGQTHGGDTVSLTFVKPLWLGDNEVTIRQNGQEQSIPVDENGKAWAVMPDGTLRRVQIQVRQEKPSRPDRPHHPDKPHRPGRPHDGHGPERPNQSIELPDVQTSGVDFRWTKMTITNYSSYLSASGTGNETVGKHGSYYEQTVIDFTSGTITSTKAMDYTELYRDEATGTHWASDVKYSSFSLSFSSATFQMGQLGDTLDKLSAAHNAFRCGGSPEKAEELYNRGVDVAANSFANLFAGFMDKLGGEERRQKIIDSVKSEAHRCDERYRHAMERHGNRRDIKEAANNHDFERLAALLHDIVNADRHASDRTEATKGGLYSQFELEYAAVSITAYSQSINAIRENGCGSEARQALNVSMFSMKMEVLSVRLGVSEEIKEVKQTIEDEANEELLDAMDENLENQRASAGLVEDAAHLFRSADRDMFRAVYHKVMDAFRKSGDALGAIREGALTAKGRMRDAMESGRPVERWENEMRPGGYWDSFFNRSPYQRSGYQEFEADWQRFMDGVGGDKGLRTKA